MQNIYDTMHIKMKSVITRITTLMEMLSLRFLILAFMLLPLVITRMLPVRTEATGRSVVINNARLCFLPACLAISL